MADILGELGINAVAQPTTTPQGKPKDILKELGFAASMPQPQQEAPIVDILGDLASTTPKAPQGPGVLGHVTSGANALVRGAGTLPIGVLDYLAATGASIGDKDVTQDYLYQAARALESGKNEVFPSDPRIPQFETAVLEGLGQISGQVAAVAGTGGTSALAQGARGLAALGVPGMSVSEAMRDAATSGASPEDIRGAGAVAGTASGLTEFLPLERVLSILDKGAPGLKQKLISTIAVGGVEAAQESLQQFIINSYAKLNYDERRELINGLGESAAVGGTVGSIAGLVASAVGGKRIKFQPSGEDKGATPPTDVPPVDTTGQPATKAPISNEKLAAFAVAAEEFGGWENIPEGHPSIAGLSGNQQVALVNKFEKLQKGETPAVPEGTPAPKQKLSFKEQMAEDVKKYATLEELEKAYANKPKQIKGARTLWKRHQESLAQPSSEVVQPEAAEVLGTEVVETPVEEQPVVAPIEEPVVQEPDVPISEEEKARLLEEINAKYADDPMLRDLAASAITEPIPPSKGPGPLERQLAQLEAPPVEDISLRSKIEHSEPTPTSTQPDGPKTFESLELAEEDYDVLPRGYVTLEQAQKAAELRGEGYEPIKVGDKYKLARDIFYEDEPPVDLDRLDEASKVEAPVEEVAPKKEVIKVGEFTKAGQDWVGQVDENRSIAIIKKGPKEYDVHLGTPQEIAQGTAELLDTFTSLQKAKSAFKNKEVAIAKKKSPAELAEAIRARRQQLEDLREESREAELARLIREQEADMLGEEDMESLEDIAEREAMADYDEDGYFDERDLKDTFDDLVTIFRDERGAINPEDNVKILAAKRRIARDVKKLGSVVSKMTGKLGDTSVEEVTKAQEEVNRTSSAWQKVQDFLKDEEGSLNVDAFTSALAELGVMMKRAWKAVRQAAKSVKNYLLEERAKNPYARFDQSDRSYLERTVLHTMQQAVKALKQDAHLSNIALFDYLKSIKRIVPEHDGKSFTPPVRQEPMINRNDQPTVKPGVTKLPPHVMGKLQSPSNIFRQVFDTKFNPMVDYMESTMAYLQNWKNDNIWMKTILRDFKDESSKIRKELDDLYAPVKELVQAKVTGDKKIATWAATLNVTQDQGRARELRAKIALEKKKQTVRSMKLKEQLFQVFDQNIVRLAKQYPTIRISLNAAGQLPAGVTLSPQELKASEGMREYFDKTALDLKKKGIPIIMEDGRTYMHRVLPQLLNDVDARGFLQDQKVPTVMKFQHQELDGRLWYPDAHTILGNYIPLVNRKLAFQPFLDRWRTAMDEVPQDISEYMNRWVKENLLAQPRSHWQKGVDQVIMFEYLRLIGGSLSVAFKHATKVADTLARFDAVTDVKAVNSTLRAVAQAAMKSAGVKGEYAELSLLKAYVNQKAMVRMLDEMPGINSLFDNAKFWAGLPTTTVETLDNGVTIFANVIASQSNGKISHEEATRIIWETVMQANFRGGPDQPLFYKKVGGRVFSMFQSTPWKLLEYRMDLIRGAVRGEVDHYGTPIGSMLVRYLLLMGMAEGVARGFGNSLLDLWLHFPYVSHFVKGSEKPPYIVPAEPTAAGSPVAEWLTQMKDDGVVSGTGKHLVYWGLPSRIYAMKHQAYPTNYYRGPVSHLFGIKRLDAKPGKSSGPSRGSRSSREARGGR